MKAFWISAVCLSLTGSLFAQSANYHLVNKTTIGGEGGWDYLLADADGGRLYVSHSTQVDVLDLKSHHIFVTTAEFSPAPAATTENPKPRPSVKPGTFMVLEYSAKSLPERTFWQ